MTAGVSGFSCKGRFHQFSLNLSSNRIANWALAIVHSRGGILHSFCARFIDAAARVARKVCVPLVGEGRTGAIGGLRTATLAASKVGLAP